MKKWNVYQKIENRWFRVSVAAERFYLASGLAKTLNEKTQTNDFCINGEN